MAVREEREEDGRDVRPPATIWMLLSVPVLVVAMVGFLSLFSYDASDIGRVVAPANEQAVNWMGSLGAWSAHGLYALFGFGAYGVPLVLFISGAMMLARVRIGLRGFWMGLSVFCVSALLQFANTAVSSLIEGGRYNFAPHAGGGFGYLLNDLTFSRWIGVPGTAVLYSLLWVVCVVMVIGPAAIMDYFFVLCAREREIARQVEEMEDEADAGEVRRKARAEARARARAEKQAQAEQTQAAREQARLERVAVETEREVNRKLWWKRFWKEAEVEEEPEAEQTVENAVAVEVRTAAPERPKRVRRVEVVVPTASQSSTTSGGAGEPDGIPVAVETNEKPTTKARPVAVSAPVAAPTPVAAPAPAPVASARLTPAADGVHKPALTSSFVPNEVTFKLPTTRLLHEPPEVVEEGNQAELEERKEMIMNTLAEFGIHVGVTGVVRGPVITCYEIKPPPGVKVDKISSYSSDLQMALQARSLRILSPIPGKNVMGIEVPNAIRRSVFIREVAESEAWKTAAQKMALPMLLGLDVSGEPVIADLAKMPHILIAGTTGSGKSVCLNSILAGFLLTRTPDDLRLLMVDPKMVEFTPYTDLPHLVVPIITAPKKVAAALKWANDEMRRRLDIFRHVGVRNIVGYNTRERARQATFFSEDAQGEEASLPDKLPYIVIVIDEMADLMMAAQAEVEPRIVSLAQLSRAAGIHMILATQRPSVNVITGLIKANFPARVAFKVSQRVDSQTILDAKGAEHLIGMGDMLFSNPNGGTLSRAQGTWIDEGEVVELVDWYRKQGDPIYVEDIKNKLDRIVIKPEKDEFDEPDEDADAESEDDAEAELLRRALACIVKTQRASTSSIQRVLRIGYNRAARLMDELENRGCIGPANGSSPREILRTTLGDDPGDDASDDDAGFEDEL